MKTIILIGLIVLVTGCKKNDPLLGWLDSTSFEYFGSTVFGEISEITIKQIHLDTGLLANRELVIEGSVLDFGKFSTYMIVGTEAARMLVVLTDVDVDVNEDVEQAVGGPLRWVRVFGTVHGGQKGLPYFLAKSVNFSASEKKEG